MSPARRAACASVALAVAASTVFVVVPTGTAISASPGPGGSPDTTLVTHHTRVEHEGSSVLIVLAVPVAIAALGVVVPARPGRVLATMLLWASAALGAATVGLFYAPAALAMAVAAFSGAETTK